VSIHPIAVLLSALAALTAVFVGGWANFIRAARRASRTPMMPATDARWPTAFQVGLGAVVSFFDTLGIGSFATTTAVFRLRRMVPDRIIPGTLNAGNTLPTIAQAFVFISIIEVDMLTLFSMIASSVLGAWMGAGVVARLPRRRVLMWMSVGLFAAAASMLMTQLGIFPEGGAAIGVRGVKLGIAIVGVFVLGALMTVGVGMNAPCMILVSLLGMSLKAAFPIMMGTGAFLMPVGSLRFMRERSYSLRPALGLTLGGVPAVFLAAYIVKELPLYAIRWLVIGVITYTAVTMLASAMHREQVVAGASVDPNVEAESAI
jgi:uncharacterized membrane protein YfcA